MTVTHDAKITALQYELLTANQRFAASYTQLQSKHDEDTTSVKESHAAKLAACHSQHASEVALLQNKLAAAAEEAGVRLQSENRVYANNA